LSSTVRHDALDVEVAMTWQAVLATSPNFAALEYLRVVSPIAILEGCIRSEIHTCSWLDVPLGKLTQAFLCAGSGCSRWFAFPRHVTELLMCRAIPEVSFRRLFGSWI
jgi:hypothetical protein